MTTYVRNQRVSFKTSERDIYPYSGVVQDVGPSTITGFRWLTVQFDHLPTTNRIRSDNRFLRPWRGHNPFDLEEIS